MQAARVEAFLFCGEPVSADDLELLRAIAADCAGLSRTEIANTVCELLDWRRVNGRLKTVECRALLEELESQGILRLPQIRPGRPRGSRTSTLALPEPEISLSGACRDFGPIELFPVTSTDDNAKWRSLVDRHHYLGHRVPFGAHLRYFIKIHAPAPVIIGCLQFSSPAWRMAARDSFIGWDETARLANLQRIVSNSRFLILPSVRIKNLASSVLSLASRRIADDWESRYGVRPLLMETLVDTAKYRGTCYRAANWLEVGVTTGRGRNDSRHARHGVSPKTVFLSPLTKDATARLREA